ncbi:hypothetical protein HN695_07765 [Candidatus Woesearchaeota archaeon]|jgi:hypothetical protein|nr:hypothetical protein [Candidatus Woesearchaeota archaeon]MBT5272431.1 hypothetical protein [Candidatus Woesearchaeota archaeon]MBT6041227.1 hypothetical protein [Candidatus Woesearchaeota archaeon]MBT6337485.1 hypothetical protein [Candidatus Woesearchaeota archaeon]MBT7928202.1 hypothetical protein [Candidatus Woesearchaeota archaeon]
MVQVIITLLGLITILAGVLPFIGNFVSLPSAIIGGLGYSIIIIIIGLIGLIYGFTSISLIGGTKFVMVCLGLLTLLGGIVPLLDSFLELAIPISGPIYPAIIILIGIIGFSYGLKHF